VTPEGNKPPHRYFGVTSLGANQWKAQICYNKKTHHLGMFKTAKEAAEAYDKTLRGNNPNHSEIWQVCI
jgi:hypothetical protein